MMLRADHQCTMLLLENNQFSAKLINVNVTWAKSEKRYQAKYLLLVVIMATIFPLLVNKGSLKGNISFDVDNLL